MDSKRIAQWGKQFGDAFYLLDTAQFQQNFLELKEAFLAVYPNVALAYSYKTNYTPKLCKIIKQLGGYAEVVSDMELELALRIGVPEEKIIWNGPYKNYKKVEKLLLTGGMVNLDSVYEIPLVKELAEKYPNKKISLGIRVNFDIKDHMVSRFGFDILSEEFQEALRLEEIENIHIAGIHCHFASRSLETWQVRTEQILKLIDQIGIHPEYLDLGGGLFGRMEKSLKEQFPCKIPTYQEYARTAAQPFAEYFSKKDKPLLLLEPGSALVGDCMHFFSKVINIKTVRGKAIATLLGSVYNINPTLNEKNPPISIYPMGEIQKHYYNLDFGGFTCIESDYLYRSFDGALAVGDFVGFGNVGSYSVVLKPPFILPNFPVIDLEGNVIKQAECFDDLFHTFEF